jgi:hypothetical protein
MQTNPLIKDSQNTEHHLESLVSEQENGKSSKETQEENLTVRLAKRSQ